MLVAGGHSVSTLGLLPSGVPGLQKVKEKFCAKLRTPPEATVGIGLHGDGVPMQKNGKSIDVFSWNLLATPQGDRYPFTMIEDRYMCKCGCKGRCTVDAILGVLLWCMRCLLVNRMPTARHDGTDWLPTDKVSKGRDGEELGCFGGVWQGRGDWPFLKKIFGFKGWASKSICWMFCFVFNY